MDLLADLRQYPAADALQWAAGARFTGNLEFQRNRRTLTMALDDGQIVRCHSSRPHESFRQHLYSQGWVDQLDLVAADRLTKPDGLAWKLVELKVLTERQGQETFTAHTLDLACSVVLWPDGVVAASRHHLRPLREPAATPLNTVFATMEAARRADELDRIRRVIAHDNVLLGAGDPDASHTGHRPAEQRLLESFNGAQTVSELYQVVGGCRYNFMRNLEQLVDGDVMRCVAVGPPPAPPEENRLTLVDVALDRDLEQRLMA